MIQRRFVVIVIIKEEISLIEFRDINFTEINRSASKVVLNRSPVGGEAPEGSFSDETTQKCRDCNDSDSVVDRKLSQSRDSVDGFESKIGSKESSSVLPGRNLVIDLLDLSLLRLIDQGRMSVDGLVTNFQIEKHFCVDC